MKEINSFGTKSYAQATRANAGTTAPHQPTMPPDKLTSFSTSIYFEGLINGVAFDFSHIEGSLTQWSKALASFFMKDTTMYKIKPQERIILLSFKTREKADEILRQEFYLEGTPVPLKKVIQWGAQVLPVHLRNLPGGDLDSLQDKITNVLEPIGRIISFQFDRCDWNPIIFETSATLLFDLSDQMDLPSKLPSLIEVMGTKVHLGWRGSPKITMTENQKSKTNTITKVADMANQKKKEKKKDNKSQKNSQSTSQKNQSMDSEPTEHSEDLMDDIQFEDESMPRKIIPLGHFEKLKMNRKIKNRAKKNGRTKIFLNPNSTMNPSVEEKQEEGIKRSHDPSSAQGLTPNRKKVETSSQNSFKVLAEPNDDDKSKSKKPDKIASMLDGMACGNLNNSRYALRTLRVCKAFPVVALRSKLAYNARDLLDLYRCVEPGGQRDALIKDGYKDLAYLSQFHHLTEEDLSTLFKVHVPRD
ncbi:hypothetical protein BJ684DRAFT_20971 [Piptocephalis cylindrospora]|uniref:Uncharacterized protein n=1 Tax=Piptocephalis cylindrospora TaxID=1907219 RepID=A0A4P9Y319_9FUNG|nr:hypothetical protein BJ684DRAFT_20971 [Piptocephalis cylindrospora]|eukprot:RKP12491.1 hypothetical protein BJ684DRAFT_20971 [Piptocephalis cylindrospora]